MRDFAGDTTGRWQVRFGTSRAHFPVIGWAVCTQELDYCLGRVHPVISFGGRPELPCQVTAGRTGWSYKDWKVEEARGRLPDGLARGLWVAFVVWCVWTQATSQCPTFARLDGMSE